MPLLDAVAAEAAASSSLDRITGRARATPAPAAATVPLAAEAVRRVAEPGGPAEVVSGAERLPEIAVGVEHALRWPASSALSNSTCWRYVVPVFGAPMCR